MTWKSFQDQAYRLTEQEIEKLIPYVVAQYRLAIKDINSQLKDVYTNILSGVKPADYYNTMLKYDRLTKLLDSVTKSYAVYSRKVGKTTGDAGKIAMSNNFYRLQFTNKWLIPGIDFALLPDDLIQIAVYGSTEAFKKYQSSALKKIFGDATGYMPKAGTLTEFLVNNRFKEVENIQRAITQGLLNGQSYTKTAKSIRDVIGQFIKVDGKVHATGAMANSMRIIRTESTRILNEASLINTEYARSEGIDIVRFWNATFDIWTRASHARLDDKPEDKNGLWHIRLDSARNPGGFNEVGNNVNCRCSTFESVNGSKPSLRRGRNPETGESDIFSYSDYSAWATKNGLTENKFGELIPRK